ncbi:MAG: hypothetical protein SGI87_07675 [Flavobacteriales bacterium]|nr:hypothetical protein [Flavobacteriales bacterium]
MKLFSIYLIGMLLFPVADSLFAQLPEQEKKFLAKLNTELNLTSVQFAAIEKIYNSKQLELNACDSSIKVFEKTLDDEVQLQTKVSALNQKKKDIRDMRELDVRLQLNPAQLKIYDEKIKPVKPQVLHFGLHNRADCKVCTQ